MERRPLKRLTASDRRSLGLSPAEERWDRQKAERLALSALTHCNVKSLTFELSTAFMHCVLLGGSSSQH